MIRFRPAAARELAADFRYYEKRYTGRGARFVAAVDATLDDVIDVLAVAHAKRRPGYWRRRLK